MRQGYINVIACKASFTIFKMDFNGKSQNTLVIPQEVEYEDILVKG